MLITSIPVVESVRTEPGQVSSLLAQQGFEVPGSHGFHDNFSELLKAHYPAFGLTTPQGYFMTQLLDGCPDGLRTPDSGQPRDARPEPEAKAISRLSALGSLPHASCPVAQSILCMRNAADLLDLQFKIFTIFNGQLSARKVGAKAARRVHLFANSDNQYVVLSKRDSNDSLLSSIEADSFSTSTVAPKALDASVSTGTSMTVSSGAGSPACSPEVGDSETAGRPSNSALASGGASLKSRSLGSLAERLPPNSDSQCYYGWTSHERRAFRPELSRAQLGCPRLTAN